MRAEIWTDGGSRGNPGISAIGFIISTAGVPPFRHGEVIGLATNNVAEYRALIEALKTAQRLGFKEVYVNVDAKLLVGHLVLEWKRSEPSLWPLIEEAERLLKGFEKWTLNQIPREQNRLADRLVNDALDGKVIG